MSDDSKDHLRSWIISTSVALAEAPTHMSISCCWHKAYMASYRSEGSMTPDGFYNQPCSYA